MQGDERELNRRVLENFIKAGAFDSFGATRRQLMSVYAQLFEEIQKNQRDNMAGQMTLFDLMGEEERKEFEVQLPPIGEFDKSTKLAFEKEVLGIYVSGHPMEEYVDLWKKHVTNRAGDFLLQEETNQPLAKDGERTVIGGLVAEKKVKYTKNDKVMAFLMVEDLTGSVEVIVFPKTYEQYGNLIEEDGKIFVEGRVSLEDEKDGRVIAQKIIPFDRIPKKLWIRFPDKETYAQKEAQLLELVVNYGGRDQVVIYIENPKAKKVLPPGQGVQADEDLLTQLGELFGKENVTLV